MFFEELNDKASYMPPTAKKIPNLCNCLPISEIYMAKMFGINGWIRFWKKLPNLKILIIWWMPSLMTIQKRNSKLEN